MKLGIFFTFIISLIPQLIKIGFLGIIAYMVYYVYKFGLQALGQSIWMGF